MEKFIIKGGTPLKGEVQISGAKNAAVAIIPAAILAADKCVLENVPSISDVEVALEILSSMGAEIKRLSKSKIEVDTSRITDGTVPYDLARSTRGSSYFLGALLGRFKKASVPLPGGCDLGSRPIDQHIKCFEALGAKADIKHGIVDLSADKLIGTQIYFDKVTVGGTINALLACAQAEGLTIIENAAKEPHIVDLANFLNSMGADIRGAGTDSIRIQGVERLHGAEHTVIADRIEAGSFLVAGVVTQGDVLVTHCQPSQMEVVLDKLRATGAVLDIGADWVRVRMTGRPKPVSIRTVPHPGFPTDMQAQFMTLNCFAEGTANITETIFENRFMHVPELCRMGAHITIEGHTAIVEGVAQLTGTTIMATDLRASASLVIAALAAQGSSTVDRIYHLDRGYERMEEKLRALGADIVRIDV